MPIIYIYIYDNTKDYMQLLFKTMCNNNVKKLAGGFTKNKIKKYKTKSCKLCIKTKKTNKK